MISLALAVVISSELYQRLGIRPLWIMLGCGVAGLIVQMVYARALHQLLGGADPVAEFRARNLKELRRAVYVPMSIVVLDIVAKTLLYSAVGGMIFALGLA